MDFVRCYFFTNEILGRWTYFSSILGGFAVATTQKWWKKCSTDQSFILKEATPHKICILGSQIFSRNQLLKINFMLIYLIALQWNWLRSPCGPFGTCSERNSWNSWAIPIGLMKRQIWRCQNLVFREDSYYLSIFHGKIRPIWIKFQNVDQRLSYHSQYESLILGPKSVSPVINVYIYFVVQNCSLFLSPFEFVLYVCFRMIFKISVNFFRLLTGFFENSQLPHKIFISFFNIFFLQFSQTFF